MNVLKCIIGASAFWLILASCGSVKMAQLTMFNALQDKSTILDSLPTLVIQPDDILSIQVSSRNPEKVRSFQRVQDFTGASGERALGIQEGYRVDENGLIFLPFLGEVQAASKTISRLREEITDSLVKFVPDVSVQIRFVSFRVTLLGEVNRPNTYTIPNERLNILEAIGMAGDFTPYAMRDSILLIRQRTAQRKFVRINTQSEQLFNSPYFYLSPNDIIYVAPLKARQYATEGDVIERYSRVFLPLVSLVTFLIGIGLRK